MRSHTAWLCGEVLSGDRVRSRRETRDTSQVYGRINKLINVVTYTYGRCKTCTASGGWDSCLDLERWRVTADHSHNPWALYDLASLVYEDYLARVYKYLDTQSHDAWPIYLPCLSRPAMSCLASVPATPDLPT